MSDPNEPWRFGWGFFKFAMKNVPSVKWALGVVAIAFLPWMFLQFSGQSPIAFLFTVLIMLFLMVLLVQFARLSTLPKRTFFNPAAFMVWGTTLMSFVVIVSLYTSVFWRFPLDLSGVLLEIRKEEPIQSEQARPISADLTGSPPAGPKPITTQQPTTTTTEVFRVGDTLGSNKILN